MPPEKLGYVEVLADLETKKAAIDAAITALRTALTIGALGQSGDADLSVVTSFSSGVNGGPIDLPKGALLGKSLPAAIKIYLAALKQKQTTREIATGLKEGGVESTSGNFENVVMGALNRLKVAGDVLRFKDGWGLAEFYPENLRARLVQESKPKTKKANSKPAKSTKPRKGARGEKKQGPTIDSRILDALGAGGNTPTALSQQLTAPGNVVGLALGRLAHKGKVEKLPNGIYVRKDVANQPTLRAV